MIGDIADRTPGASKLHILNAVGSDSRVGKKCAPCVVCTQRCITRAACRVLRARAAAAVECDSSLVAAGTCALATALAAPLLPSRQPGVRRACQVGGCEPFAARSDRRVQQAAHALSNRRAAGSEQRRVRVHWYKDPCPVAIIEESQKLVIAQALARAGKRVVLRDRDYLIKASSAASMCTLCTA